MDTFETAKQIIICHDVCHMPVFSADDLKVILLFGSKRIVASHDNDAGWVDYLDFHAWG